jgi:hypothetical protein
MSHDLHHIKFASLRNRELLRLVERVDGQTLGTGVVLGNLGACLGERLFSQVGMLQPELLAVVYTQGSQLNSARSSAERLGASLRWNITSISTG